VSSGVERYLRTLPIKLTLSRNLSVYNYHVAALLFPGARTLHFELLPKVNTPESWKMILCELKNPYITNHHITYDVICDKAGRDLHSVGYFRQALDMFNRGLQITPNDPILTHNVGVTLLELGDYVQAKHWVETSYKADPTCPQTRSRLVEISHALGDTSSLARINELVGETNSSYHSLMARANILMREGRVAEACSDWDVAHKTNKLPLLYRERYAAALTSIGLTSRAREILHEEPAVA